MDIFHPSDRFKYFIDEKIEPDKWDKSKGRSKKDRNLNEFLDELELKFKSLCRRLTLESDLNKASITRELDIMFGKVNNKIKLSDWIVKVRDRKIADPTIDNDYKSSWNMTILQVKDHDTDLKTTNKTYLEDLKANMFNNGYSLNSAKLMFALIKQSLISADAEGLFTYNARQLSVKFPKYHKINAYHPTAEQDEISRVILPGELDYVRVLYLIGCKTGQRVNKWMHFNQDYIQGDYLSVTSRKSIYPVKIKLTQKLEELLHRAGTLQAKHKAKSDTSLYQHILKSIPTICRSAGIDQPFIRQERDEKQKLVDVTYEKWQVCKTHTARRSYCCVEHYENQTPLREIMKNSGHEYLSSLERYLMASA